MNICHINVPKYCLLCERNKLQYSKYCNDFPKPIKRYILRDTWFPVSFDSCIIILLQDEKIQDVRHIMVFNSEGISSQDSIEIHNPQLETAQAWRLNLELHTNDLNVFLVLWNA